MHFHKKTLKTYNLIKNIIKNFITIINNLNIIIISIIMHHQINKKIKLLIINNSNKINIIYYKIKVLALIIKSKYKFNNQPNYKKNYLLIK